MIRRLQEEDFAVALLAIGIIVGLFSPNLTAAMAPLALPALFLVIVFSMVPFADEASPSLLRVDRRVVRMAFWQQIVLPILVVSCGVVARLDDYVISLMIVTACSGSLFASPALAGLLNLDRHRALQCMVLSTLIMPISLYFFLKSLHGVNVHLELGTYLERTAVFLAIPFVIFAVYQAVSKAFRKNVRVKIKNVSRWAGIGSLLVFGIAIMDSASHQLLTNPTKIVFYLVLVSLLSFAMLVLTVIVMQRFGIKEALTAGILNGFRNVGLGFALVGNMIGSELAPYVGVSMIPIFVAPAVIRLATATQRPAYAHDSC